MVNQEQLTVNTASLMRTLEKHGENLNSVSLGVDLYFHIVGNYYNHEKVSAANTEQVTLVLDEAVEGAFYRMDFKDGQSRGYAQDIKKVKKEESLAGLPVVIVQNTSRLLKKELKQYVGQVGNCLLELKAQGQYIVEFPTGAVVALPLGNVKPIRNLEMVTDETVKEAYSNGQLYSSTVLDMDASKEEIETYLQSQVGKVDAVIVTRRYFLTEL